MDETSPPVGRVKGAPTFEALFSGVCGPAYGYALRLTRSRADAEDLVQSAALSAFRAWGTFTEGGNFKAWFFRILVREFWGRHRTAQRRPSTVGFDDLPDLVVYTRATAAGLATAEPDPATQLIDGLGVDGVTAALDALPEDYRVVAILYFMQDFSYRDIAGVLEIPIGTVRSRLHRGRKMLQRALWDVACDAGLVAEMGRELIP